MDNVLWIFSPKLSLLEFDTFLNRSYVTVEIIFITFFYLNYFLVHQYYGPMFCQMCMDGIRYLLTHDYCINEESVLST